MDERVAAWRKLAANLVEGRDVILAGGVLAGFTQRVKRLREFGVRRVLCVVNGTGTGPLPEGDDVEVVDVPFTAVDVTAEFRQWDEVLAHPPPNVVDAVERFDPNRDALLLISSFQPATHLGDRPGFGPRRPEWVALEDKTVCDALFERAGIAHPPHLVVDAHDAAALRGAARELDTGGGTVWAGDASRGFNGGGEFVRWIRPRGANGDVDDACAFYATRCERVRVSPFVEGIPCSLHGFVTDDGISVLRPVELVTLRPPAGNKFQYAGAATYWDPEPADREAMRTAVRRVGEQLRAEVDYRGMFTVDGILARDGWLPTELNPRVGAAIGYSQVAVPDAPFDFLQYLVVAGETSVRAADLEAVTLPAADALRWGGGWTTVPTQFAETQEFTLARDHGDPVDGTLLVGPSAIGGFVRITFDADRTPVGPSIAPLVAAAFAYADERAGTGIGPLGAPHAVR